MNSFEKCPYCEKDISTAEFVMFNPTIKTCPECLEKIVIDPHWICDPECESDGDYVFNLYTIDEAIKEEIYGEALNDKR